MTRIEQLESQLKEKIQGLDDSLIAQNQLRDTLISNTKTMAQVKRQLKEIEDYLRYSNDTLRMLKRENQSLKSAGELWMKRAIQLEFMVLSAGDAAKNS